MQCRQCHQSLPDGAKFCRFCGVSQAAAGADPLPPTPSMNPPGNACPACAAPLAANARFCGKCGTSQATAMPADSASIAANTAEASMQPGDLPPPLPSERTASAAAFKPVAQKSSFNAIAAAVGVAVLVLAGSGGYWAWTKKKAADVQAQAQLAQREAEERRKSEEEIQRKIDEAAEKAASAARAEAEARAKAELEEKLAAAASSGASATPADPVAQAAACNALDLCLQAMLESASAHNQAAWEAAAARIVALPRPVRGDRKAARSLNADALRELGKNNYQEAVALLERAAAVDPSDVEILSNLGLALTRVNRLSDADRTLRSALLIDPRRTGAWVPLADVLEQQGRKEQALASLLLGYEFSGNKEKTLAYFGEKSGTSERESMRAVFMNAASQLAPATAPGTQQSGMVR